ncbi:MAG: hypothetical protein JSV92_01620, partial [archaeon]
LGAITFASHKENPDALKNAYVEYIKILNDTKKDMDTVNKCMNELKEEFKIHEKSGKDDSKILENGQTKLRDMYRTKNNSPEFKEIEKRREDKTKEYLRGRWIRQKSVQKGKSFGNKLKNSLRDHIYKPITFRTKRKSTKAN